MEEVASRGDRTRSVGEHRLNRLPHVLALRAQGMDHAPEQSFSLCREMDLHDAAVGPLGILPALDQLARLSTVHEHNDRIMPNLQVLCELTDVRGGLTRVALDREQQEILLGSCAATAGFDLGLSRKLAEGIAKGRQLLILLLRPGRRCALRAPGVRRGLASLRLMQGLYGVVPAVPLTVRGILFS